ncbi:MAG: hypothetical protein P4L84_37410 [Isosphaeraceae bacterium]|nr:hypothetical protein [Isosphaeraceae bacterium]
MVKRTVRRRFEFERLEQRETPSAGLGGSAIHDLAKHAKTVALHGGGTATYSSRSAATVTGNSTILGNFTGTITIPSSGQAVVVLHSGSNTLDLAVKGSSTQGKVSHFKGTFTITGGTNQFMGFTGNGTITSTQALNAPAFSFSINGKVTE